MIELTDVSLRAGGRALATGISVRLRRGELVGVAGPSGSGKSTLLRVLATLRPPDGGSVRPDVPAAAWRAQLGWLGHDVASPDALTAEDYLAGHARLRGVGRDAPARALGAFALSGHARICCGSLSRGERRRLELARACMGEPALLLLDAPQDGLDAPGRAALDALLGRTRDRGAGAVIADFDATWLTGRCDRVLWLDGNGAPARWLAQPHAAR